MSADPERHVPDVGRFLGGHLSIPFPDRYVHSPVLFTTPSRLVPPPVPCSVTASSNGLPMRRRHATLSCSPVGPVCSPGRRPLPRRGRSRLPSARSSPTLRTGRPRLRGRGIPTRSRCVRPASTDRLRRAIGTLDTPSTRSTSGPDRQARRPFDATAATSTRWCLGPTVASMLHANTVPAIPSLDKAVSYYIIVSPLF